ncbi:unnamed protein product [Tenebrio molitor]|nr:unnamed protein product [Tenebrio molitor]
MCNASRFKSYLSILLNSYFQLVSIILNHIGTIVSSKFSVHCQYIS